MMYYYKSRNHSILDACHQLLSQVSYHNSYLKFPGSFFLTEKYAIAAHQHQDALTVIPNAM